MVKLDSLSNKAEKISNAQPLASPTKEHPVAPTKRKDITMWGDELAVGVQHQHNLEKPGESTRSGPPDFWDVPTAWPYLW